MYFGFLNILSTQGVIQSHDVCPGLTVSLSVPKHQVSLSIRVMHFRGGQLEELKGKHPRGQWGERTIPIFLSKPVSPSLLGEYEKPSLSAWPCPVVPLGQTVTLQYHFGPPFVIFRLLKRDGAILPKLQGYDFNTFTIDPVTRKHTGSYTCLSLCGPMSVTPCRLWSQVGGVQLSSGHLCLQAILP